MFAWKIGDHQCRPALSAIDARKRYDNDFASYRFDHAASSSGEFQSRPRTDSLSSAPLNAAFSSASYDSRSFSSVSGVLMKELFHVLPRRLRGTRRIFLSDVVYLRCLLVIPIGSAKEVF